MEIIDYKTDAVAATSELIDRYSGQMNAYREVMRGIYPAAEIDCILLSVRHGELVMV